MQHSMFSDSNMPKASVTGLVISKAGKKTLSKNQQEFNKLTLRIEKLQKEIEKKQDKFDLAIKMFGKDLYPLKTTLMAERRENVIALWEHYKTKKLSQKDQQALKEILREQLQEIFAELTEEPDDTIKLIFKALEGQNYDNLVEQEKEEALKQIKASLKKMKIDISDIDDVNDLESLEKKLYEYNAKINEEGYFEKTNTKQKFKKEKTKSAKQIEAEKMQEAAEELKKKNIGTIYKQLAKLFHPDLEQDEERKAEKVLLMQELTAAYEAKNLHALLTLELKWIHKENDHLESLTEEKLAVYLQILKEQIQDLTSQKQQVIYQPKYAVLVETFGWQVQQSPIETITRHLTEIKNVIDQLKLSIGWFNSDNGLRHIKAMIKEWKEEQAEMNDEDELFRMLFGK
jgi:hypothetical protein